MKTNHPFSSTRSPWTTALLVATAAVALALNTQAAPGGGGQPTATPVCFEFRHGATDKLNSDDAGAYCHNLNAKVSAQIPTDGPAIMDSNTGKVGTLTGRTVFLDFSNCAVTPDNVCSPPPLPDTRFGQADTDPNSGYPDDVYMRTVSFANPDGEQVFLPLYSILKNQTRAHGFMINLWLKGQRWMLEYGQVAVNDPNATLVLITRLTDKTQGDACDSWWIEAPSSPAAAIDANGDLVIAHDVARLTKASKNGSLSGQPSSGLYHMPFAILVTDDLSNQCPQ